MSSSPVLGIVHTSFALVDLLNGLAKQRLPDVRIVNIVDDTLLSYARERGVDDSLRRRMKNFFVAAKDAGATVVLNACSSVGETVDAARTALDIPILKIDEPMAEQAVRRGRRIAVLATVESTMGPTCRLLQKQALEAGRDVQLTELVCKGCFELLLAGQTAEHDRRVAQAVRDAARNHDVLVFAQASMSRLVPQLKDELSVPLLASPELAMTRLRDMLAAVPAAT
jgi:Asp/Glu/hydantoin racemase